MQRKILTEHGECHASIKTESEIESIRQELESMQWLPQTLRWLEAVKDPTRFQIVLLLYSYEQFCVCDLANILGISSSAVSQHLRKLRDMEIVSSSRVKQTIFYRLQSEPFAAFFKDLIPEEFKPEALEACA